MDKLPRNFPVLLYPQETYDYLMYDKPLIIDNDELINKGVFNKCPGLAKYVRTISKNCELIFSRHPSLMKHFNQDDFTEDEIIRIVIENENIMKYIAQTEAICLAFLDNHQFYYLDESKEKTIDSLINISTPAIEKVLATRKMLKEPYEWDDEEYCIELINNWPKNITKIVNPSIKMLACAVNLGYHKISVDDMPDDVRLTMIKTNPDFIVKLKNPTEEEQITAIREDPRTIRWIANPCEAALQLCYETNPYFWMGYAKNKSRDMCINIWERYNCVLEDMPDEYITEDMVRRTINSGSLCLNKLAFVDENDDDTIVKLLELDSEWSSSRLPEDLRIRLKHFRRAIDNMVNPGHYIKYSSLSKKKYQKLAEIIAGRYPDQMVHLRENRCDDFFVICAKAIQNGYRGKITVSNMERYRVNELLEMSKGKVIITDLSLKGDAVWKFVIDQDVKAVYDFRPKKSKDIDYKKYNEIVVYALTKVIKGSL